MASVLATTVRQIVIHPVVLPVLAGLAWNAGGVALPAVIDQTLESLSAAAVPLCLVLLDVSLAQHGVRGALASALRGSLVKLVLVPALVLSRKCGLPLSLTPSGGGRRMSSAWGCS